jgi:hypothetical protein
MNIGASNLRRTLLTQEDLMDRLEYDQETGDFTYAKSYFKCKKGNKAGHPNRDGYLVIMIARRYYKCHRLAWLYVHGEWPSKDLDHINGIRSDNRITNLREATRNQNGHNRKLQKNNICGVKGVNYRESRNRWVTRVRFNNKVYHIGTFKTLEEAKSKREEKAKELHGEFYRSE